MIQKTLPRLTLLSLGLALALAAGCKKADQTGAASPTPGSAAGTSTGTTAGSTSSQPGSPGATASPANPAAVAGATPAAPGAEGAGVPPEKMPAIVAKVNGQGIKKDDLVKGAQVVRMQMARMGQPMAMTPQFYRQVLDELIGITLLQQEAKTAGTAPSDAEVTQQLEARKKQFPSPDAYQQALKQMGITENDLRQQIRDQITVQKYVQTKVLPGVNVTDQSARAFYEQNKAQIHTPEGFHVRHILVKVEPNATAADKQKAKAKAEDLHKQIQNGGDFAKLAQESSDDPGSKTNGGDLGWMAAGQTPPAFEKAVMSLKPNEVSPVVESPFGYHVIQLLEKRAPADVPFEQVKDRISAMLKQKGTQEAVQNRIKDLRSKAKVEVFI